MISPVNLEKPIVVLVFTILVQVWVMGEHPNDRSIESILEEETRARALAQARQEAHQLRKSVEKELTHLIEYRPLDSLEQVRNKRKKYLQRIVLSKRKTL